MIYLSEEIDSTKIRIRKSVKINGAAKKSKIQAQTLRIKNDIKFLCKKEQQLNLQIYQAHIRNANIRKKIWRNIEQSIEQK
jgi:hypothetical protein